jgi:hypothetical protein
MTLCLCRIVNTLISTDNNEDGFFFFFFKFLRFFSSSSFFLFFLLSSSSLVRDDRRVRPLQKKMNNYFIFWFNFLDVTFICNENEMNKEFRPFLNSKFVSFLPLETL